MMNVYENLKYSLHIWAGKLIFIQDYFNRIIITKKRKMILKTFKLHYNTET